MSKKDMAEDDKGSWLTELIEGGLPQFVAGPAGKAISRLIGAGTDIPAAWIEGIAQGIRDKTSARSQISEAIATKAAEMAVDDPKIMERALHGMLAKSYRAQTNREAVAKVAVEELRQSPPLDGHSDGPSEDWMNLFMRFAEDASSERLQDMFGRVLAGEVVKPGSFSLSTLRAIAELDQQIAQDFSAMWERSVGNAVDCSSEFQLGEWYSRWQRLAEVGLMASTHTVQYLPNNQLAGDGNGLWVPISTNGITLTVHFPQNSDASWKHILFTRVGTQIGRIVAPPNYEANIRVVGQKLASNSVTRILLQTDGKPIETLYQTSAT